MKKILLSLFLFSTSYFLLPVSCLYSETTFEPYAGYSWFTNMGAVNNLIKHYAYDSRYVIGPPITFSEINGGWDFGGKLGIGITRGTPARISAISKISYLMAGTGLKYSRLEGGAAITQGDLDFFIGNPDNFKIRFLSGQVGLEIVPIKTKKTAVGLSASTGPGLCKFTTAGTGWVYFETSDSTYTYTFNMPYEKKVLVSEAAVTIEFMPFGVADRRKSGDTLVDAVPIEASPLRSTTLVLSFGGRLANIGKIKSDTNVDLDGDGIFDISKGDYLKKTLINIGDDLKLDLSSVFINLGLKLRW